MALKITEEKDFNSYFELNTSEQGDYDCLFCLQLNYDRHDDDSNNHDDVMMMTTMVMKMVTMRRRRRRRRRRTRTRKKKKMMMMMKIKTRSLSVVI